MEIKDNAKKPEIFCACAIKDYLIKDEELVVGDCSGGFLPDIYNSSYSIGIEVVQAERESDLDIKYVLEECKKNNGDFESIKKFCDNNYPDKYILTGKDDKFVSLITNDGVHRIDWMYDNYIKQITKKLKKLNNDNYSGITGEISLCISIIQRAKDIYDVYLLLYIYLQCVSQFSKRFNKLIVISSEKIYIIQPEKVEKIEKIVSQGSIVNFDVEGNDYLEILDYDYNFCCEFAREKFSDIKRC